MEKIANNVNGEESEKLKINYKAVVEVIVGSLFAVFVVIPFGVYPLVKQDRHSRIDITIDSFEYAVAARNLYVWDAVIFHGQFSDFKEKLFTEK